MTIDELAQRLEQYADPDSVERAAALLRILAVHYAAHQHMAKCIVNGCPLAQQQKLGMQLHRIGLAVDSSYDIHLK